MEEIRQEANARRWQARQLRLAGKTYREIGDLFGVTGVRARQIINAKSIIAFTTLESHNSYLAWMLSWSFQDEDDLKRATDDELTRALTYAQDSIDYLDYLSEVTIGSTIERIRRIYAAGVVT